MDRADRPAFLAAVCGEDALLRKDVESLLHSAEKTLDLLHKPVREAARAVAGGAPLSNRRIGNFELIKLIGEGGMGEVYLAAWVWSKTQVWFRASSQSGRFWRTWIIRTSRACSMAD
jgi:hypothetical protein